MTDVPTLSGNEITDVTRRNNTQGDGLLPEQGSTGIWEATTNLCTNGGLETNANTWNGSAATINRVTTDHFFGLACLSVLTNGGATDQGARTDFIAVTPSTVYSVSGWCKAPAGSLMKLSLWTYTAADAPVGEVNASFVATGSWQRVTLTNTPGGTVEKARIGFRTDASQLITFLMDGMQLEQQPLATPYVETNGASATRAIASAVAPASVLDETQTWMAFRVRMSFGPTADLYGGGYPTLMEWGDDANNKLYMGFAVDADQFYIQRRTISGAGAGFAGAYTFAPGSILTVIGRFTATEIAISINGAAFVSTANTLIPTLAATSFRILDALAANRTFDGDIFWMAAGSGALVDADAKLIAGFNNDPKMADFPGTPTWFWDSGPDGSQVPLVLGQLGTGRV